MELVADLHIHSRYSRATSRQLDLEHLWVWAQRKGVTVIGTGDFTHPGWFAEIEKKLVPSDDDSGLFALEPGLARALVEEVPPPCAADDREVRFMLTVEISNIYKHDGKTRKVHNLVCVPDLAAAAALNRALDRIGNIQSDGRPILGLDSRDLLEIVLGTSERSVLIPAHIWTPWFSVLGSKSGFDSIEACYRDLSDQIFAVETGLSSDPPMNWRLSALDRYALVSHSDAHSPAKLAREADLFDCPVSYDAIFEALRTREGFLGTVEFFPEEGKYHLDGHRKCGTRMTPAETREHGGRCPVCGKPVTVGVMYRVEELADRPEGTGPPPGAAPYTSLVGLAEVLSEVLGKGPGTKAVQRSMEHLLDQLGPELSTLRAVPLEDLERAGGPVLAEAVRRMRSGEVQIEGGYDGEFGTVHLLDDRERKQLSGQTALFAIPQAPEGRERGERLAERPRPAATAAGVACEGPLFGGALETYTTSGDRSGAEGGLLGGLNPAQRQGVVHQGSPVVITAGPGTGKTRCLTHRIAYRVEEGEIEPSHVLAVTFTTKAAAELRTRLRELLGQRRADAIVTTTFHALALRILNEWRRTRGEDPLQVLEPDRRLELLAELQPGLKHRELSRISDELGLAFARDERSSLRQRYQELLKQRHLADLDAMIPDAVELLHEEPDLLAAWRERCRTVCVDEYQDVNQGQVELLRLLCQSREDPLDLCVIGDPDQAIYSFRGADPGFFLRFHEDYPEADRITLETSYRTARSLLEAAQQVIRHNPDRPESRTWSDLPGAARVTICPASTGPAEAELVVHSIERMVSGTTFFSIDSGRVLEEEAEEYSFGDFAVLFRLRAQADLLREAFDRSGIPYLCPVARAPVLEPVLDLLRAIAHPSVGEDERSEPISTQLQGLSPREGLELLVQQLCPEEQQEAALDQTRQLASMLWSGTRVEPRLWASQTLALHAATTEADRIPTEAEAVNLLTLHASKGLEFSVVFIVGCEEGLLPHLVHGEADSEDLKARIAEERRLFYVGMTRARRRLILTHAAKRRHHGAVARREPSRFLVEIQPRLVQTVLPDPLPKRRRRPTQIDLFE